MSRGMTQYDTRSFDASILDPERFRAYLESIWHPAARFTVDDICFCPLACFLNKAAPEYDQRLCVGLNSVYVYEGTIDYGMMGGAVSEMPAWARDFQNIGDRDAPMSKLVSAKDALRALDEATGVES